MDKSELFKLIWRGYVVGLTALFLPFVILAPFLVPQTPDEPSLWLAIPMIPIVAALQGVMFGGLVLLGLKIWPPKTERSE